MDAAVVHLSAEDLDTLIEEYSFPWEALEKTQEKWNRYYTEHQNEKRTVALLKANKKIVGYGSLLYTPECPFFSDTPEISDVWIHEKHRRVGLGSSLIHWFENLAKKKGYKDIGIGVGLYSDYGPAQKLYVKLGYVPDGNGITYQCQKTIPGEPYPLDDDLVLWLKKILLY